MTEINREYFSKIPPVLYQYICQNPIAYSAYRVLHIRSNEGILTEANEIPFIKTPVYVFALISYLLILRVVNFIEIITQRNQMTYLTKSTHLFIVGTSENYRTFSLKSIARSIHSESEVAFLCSPSARIDNSTVKDTDCKIFRHTELHKNVPLTSVVLFLFKAVAITIQTKNMTPHQTTIYDTIIAYNYLITEFVKKRSVAKLMQNEPYVHTYSPMPYLVENTHEDKIFVYQHGIQWKSANTLMAVPFYVPLTYFVWSSVWMESFEDAAHPDSKIIPVGSPWHDHLAKNDNNQNPTFDVLLLSQSHGHTPNDEKYEKFVRTVIHTCEENNLTLKIKLHPKESEGWYKNRGWNSFVESFEDIDDALQQSRIAVTDSSSAFVESSVFGTPIVVGDILDGDLRSLAPIRNVIFPANMGDVPTAIQNALNGKIPETDRTVVITGGATERIVKIINSRKEELY